MDIIVVWNGLTLFLDCVQLRIHSFILVKKKEARFSCTSGKRAEAQQWLLLVIAYTIHTWGGRGKTIQIK